MILTSPTKHFVRLSILVVCSLVFALVFVACGGGSASGGSATSSTPAAQSTATSESTSTSSTTTYTGNGFTIDYPQDWKVSTPASGQVTFGDSSGNVGLGVQIINNPNGVTPDAELSAILQKLQSDPKHSNYQKVDMPATTMVAGETWVQGAVTYDLTANGQTTSLETVVLVDNHSATKGFSLFYVAPADMFDQVNNDKFQPMLQSFAFM